MKFEKDYASVSSGNLIEDRVTITGIGNIFRDNNDSHLVAPSDSWNDDVVPSSSSKPQAGSKIEHFLKPKKIKTSSKIRQLSWQLGLDN